MPEALNDDRPPIEVCLDQWHDYRHGAVDVLDDLLDNDAVLSSPILFAPKRGKEVVKMYLVAAGVAFAGTAAQDQVPSADGEAGVGVPGDDPESATPTGNGAFRYVRTIHQGDHAVLEFETTIDGKYVNGVDLITCNADGRIVDYKVMVRPLRAVDAVLQQMRAELASAKVASIMRVER